MWIKDISIDDQKDFDKWVTKISESLPYTEFGKYVNMPLGRKIEMVLNKIPELSEEGINISTEQFENIVSLNPVLSLFYLKRIEKPINLEALELMVSTNPRTGYEYSFDVLGDRFEKGEEVIISSEFYRSKYIAFLKTLE